MSNLETVLKEVTSAPRRRAGPELDGLAARFHGDVPAHPGLDCGPAPILAVWSTKEARRKANVSLSICVAVFCGDMALALLAQTADEETAQTVQLAIEYDPQPPFDAGSPKTAPHLVKRALALIT